VPWFTVARSLVLPPVKLSGNYLTVIVAAFGTTTSPYLFLWRAGREVEKIEGRSRGQNIDRGPPVSAASNGPYATRDSPTSSRYSLC
jgi:hypothetical protein